MPYRLLHENDGQRTFAVILEAGDEAMECLRRFAESEKVTAAQLTAIGAFSDAALLYFDWTAKSYKEIPVREQVEVAAMIGDIAIDEKGASALHVHLVLGRADGSALAGHLKSGHVRPTLEVVVTESPAHLRRVRDEAVNLALIQLDVR